MLVSKFSVKEFKKFTQSIVFIKILYSNIKIIGALGVLERRYNQMVIIYCFLLLHSLSGNTILLSDKYKSVFFADLYKLIKGVTFGWYVCFNIFGRGFSFRLRSKNDNLYLKLKIGYSHFVYYKLNKEIFVKISRKRNKLFLFSLNFWLLFRIAVQLRNLRSKHTYKIQGILFYDEKFIVKPGKKKQS